MAVFWFPAAGGLQVLPEYVPPEGSHIFLLLSRTGLEHAASGKASTSVTAVITKVFLKPMICLLFSVFPTHGSARPRSDGSGDLGTQCADETALGGHDGVVIAVRHLAQLRSTVDGRLAVAGHDAPLGVEGAGPAEPAFEAGDLHLHLAVHGRPRKRRVDGDP